MKKKTRFKITQKNASRFIKDQDNPDSVEELEEQLNDDGRLFQNWYFDPLYDVMSPKTILRLGTKAIGSIYKETDDENSPESFDVGMAMPCLAMSSISGIVTYSSCSGHGKRSFAGIDFWAFNLRALRVIIDLAYKNGLSIWHSRHYGFEVLGPIQKFEAFAEDVCKKAVEKGCNQTDSIVLEEEITRWLKSQPTLTDGQREVQKEMKAKKMEFDKFWCSTEGKELIAALESAVKAG